MNQEFVTVRNLDTGKVGKVRRKIAEHPLYGLRLEIVSPGSKDLVSLDDLVQQNRKDEDEVPHLVEDDTPNTDEEDE